MKTKLFAVLLSATMGVTGSIWLIQSGFLGSLTPHDLASDMTESKAVHQPAANESGNDLRAAAAPSTTPLTALTAKKLQGQKPDSDSGDDHSATPAHDHGLPNLAGPLSAEPSLQEPLPLTNHLAEEPNAHDPRAHDPRAHDPRAHDMRAHDVRAHDVRGSDVRGSDPDPREPHAANAWSQRYAPQEASWQPLMAMQISQLSEALRQIDDHARQQQKSIDDVVDELQEMVKQRERNQRHVAQQALETQRQAGQSNSKTLTIAKQNQGLGAAIDSEGDAALNINVQDAEIRDVLDLLSQQIERNIVPLPSVSGKVTAFLTGVSIDEALAAILKSKGYIAERDGNFIYIGTKQDFKESEEEKQMETRVYHPNYISAQELQQLITPLLTVGTGEVSVGGEGQAAVQPAAGGAFGALGAIGAAAAGGGVGGGGVTGGAAAVRVSATSPTASGLVSGSTETGGMDYAGSDAVVVKDFEDVLKQIDKVVKELDQRPRQVAIEAMILTVRLNDNLRFGVNFEALQNHSDVRITSGSPLDDLVNLTTSGALKFGYLGSTLSSFIEALENVGETDIVASPRLMCLNKQQAEILIGSELGFVNTTVTQTAATQSVEFLEVGTQLRFRPFITDDNIVRLELHPELSTGTVRIEEGLTLPDKEVTKVTTNILCRDGATVIIGGLIREDLTTSVSQLPVLGSVPYLGAAFRKRTQAVDRREIIVLITPRVVTEDDSHCEGQQAQHEFLQRHELYHDKMSPLAKRHIGKRYLRQGRAAWNAGDVKNAFRYCNLALHYHPNDLDVMHLRQEILQAYPELDLPLRDRYQQGLKPWQRPVVNYPRKGVSWQSPAPIVSPHGYESAPIEVESPSPSGFVPESPTLNMPADAQVEPIPIPGQPR